MNFVAALKYLSTLTRRWRGSVPAPIHPTTGSGMVTQRFVGFQRASVTPALPQAQPRAVMPDADPLEACHYARDFKLVYDTSRRHTVFLPAWFSCLPASHPATECAVRECDDSTLHIRLGREALVSHGHYTLAALAVQSIAALQSARYPARHVLGCVRQSRAATSESPLVAAVHVQLPVRHRLASPVTPLSHHGGVAEIPKIMASPARTSLLARLATANAHNRSRSPF